MSKTLEQTIHEAELPAPAPAGEDFQSYVSRVAHAAAFIGAAWAIANGPQVQGPLSGEQGGPAEPVEDPTFDHPITVDGVPAEERGQDAPDWMSDAEVEAEQEQPEPDPLGATQPGGVQRSNGKHS